MSPDDWVRTYYTGEYLDSVAGILTPERTADEISFIVDQTALRPPARVADFGCGHGRHSLELAQRGFEVIGVDVNELPLSLARQAASPELPVTFVQADYRVPPPGPFDLVISLFGSFGFGSESEDAATLRAWCASLDDSGWMVLELWHRDAIVSRFVPRRTWRASERLEVDEQRRFDPLSGRIHVRYEYDYADGRRIGHQLAVRLYTAAEIRQILGSAGVGVVRLFGSLRGDPYSTSARSMVIIARKGVG